MFVDIQRNSFTILTSHLYLFPLIFVVLYFNVVIFRYSFLCFFYCIILQYENNMIGKPV